VARRCTYEDEERGERRTERDGSPVWCCPSISIAQKNKQDILRKRFYSMFASTHLHGAPQGFQTVALHAVKVDDHKYFQCSLRSQKYTAIVHGRGALLPTV
jgi:hypothetical protein